MKKRLVSLLLILTAALFISCNSDTSDDYIQGAYLQEGESGPSADELEDYNNGKNETEEVIENLPPNSVGTVVSEFSASVHETHNYSDGLAFVKVSYDEIEKFICIDKQGVIQFILPEKSEPRTSFKNGTALIGKLDEDYHTIYQVINKNGEIISSGDIDGYDEIIAPKLCNNSNYTTGYLISYPGGIGENGYYFFSKHTDTFESTKDEIGVIGPDGKWFIEPTEEISEVHYEGDGVYSLLGTSSEGEIINKILDTKTGEVKDSISTILCEYSTLLSEGYLVIDERFSENITVANTLGEVILSMPRTNNLQLQDKSSSNNDEVAQCGDGVFYYDKVFYNIDGSVALSLEDKKVYYDNNYSKIYPKFYDGYALIGLYNNDGSKFFAVIDKDGEIVFEPFKAHYISEPSEGIFKYLDENGEIIYRKLTGEIVYTFEPMTNFENLKDFSEGACWIYGSSGNYYIDTNGNRLF